MEFLPIRGQVAARIREELRSGRWTETMPGVKRLSDEFEVSRKTIQGALNQLEEEGLLESLGQGKNRRIIHPAVQKAAASMRIGILEYEPSSRFEAYMIELQYRLQRAGHQVVHAQKTLTELGMKVSRIQPLVKQTGADAWIVGAGSRDVLRWFAEQKAPCFALFGRRRSLRIAGVGPDQVAAHRKITQRLIALGHRRIVSLVRASQRSDGTGSTEKAILDEMQASGLPVSEYNLPDWDDHPDAFHQMLDRLFQITPPTALLIDEPFIFHAAKEFLAQRGILAPADVSLVCTDPDPTFAWCRPTVAHVRWNHGPVVRRAVQWASNVARGKDDLKQVLTPAEFVEGGTVGPAPKASG